MNAFRETLFIDYIEDSKKHGYNIILWKNANDDYFMEFPDSQALMMVTIDEANDRVISANPSANDHNLWEKYFGPK